MATDKIKVFGSNKKNLPDRGEGEEEKVLIKKDLKNGGEFVIIPRGETFCLESSVGLSLFDYKGGRRVSRRSYGNES